MNFTPYRAGVLPGSVLLWNGSALLHLEKLFWDFPFCSTDSFTLLCKNTFSIMELEYIGCSSKIFGVHPVASPMCSTLLSFGISYEELSLRRMNL